MFSSLQKLNPKFYVAVDVHKQIGYKVIFFSVQYLNLYVYRKVASRSTSRLVARSRIFRPFMKGKFDPYVL